MIFSSEKFFKIRYIYDLRKNKEYKMNEKFSYIFYDAKEMKENINEIEKYHNYNKILDSLKYDSYFILVYYEEKLVGNFIALKGLGEWHDSILIKKNEIIFVNGYVSDEYSGNGIFSSMIYKLTKEMQRKFPNHYYFDIVEKKNIASVKAHNKVVKKYKKNYLIKFFGKNIFSLFDNKIWLLTSKRKNRMI